MSRKTHRHACPECSKGFSTEWGMDEHRALKHGVERSVYPPSRTGPYCCTICHRNLRNAISLDIHMRAVHQGSAPHVDRRPQVTEVDPTCLECGGEGKLVGGKEIYPHRPDLFHKRFYLCACGAYCGCHPGSIVPLGHPCGPETRKARSAAHEAFDPLWKGRNAQMSRHQAYKWLAGELKIDPAICHIGMMTADRAARVVEVVSNRAVDASLDRIVEAGVDLLVKQGRAVRDGDRVTLIERGGGEMVQ